MVNSNQLSELLDMDLASLGSRAVQDPAWASHYLRLIISKLGELVLTVEGKIEDPNYQNKACSALLQIEEHASSLAATVRELATQYNAVVELARTLLQQRDEALNANQQLHDDLVAQVAASQEISEDAAWRLLVALANDDETVMEDYAITDLDGLLAFRDGLNSLIDQLDYHED